MLILRLKEEYGEKKGPGGKVHTLFDTHGVLETFRPRTTTVLSETQD